MTAQVVRAIDRLPAEILQEIIRHLSPKYTKRLIQASKRIRLECPIHFKILKLIERNEYLDEFLSILHREEFSKYLFTVRDETTKEEIEQAMKRRILKFENLQTLYGNQMKRVHTKYVDYYKVVFRDADFSYETNLDSLGRACYWGHLDMVQILLRNGADPSLCDNVAIRMASKNGHAEVVHLLMRSRLVDSSDQNNLCIQWACNNGHVQVVRLLLRDPRVDPSVNNNQCIKKASENGHYKVVQTLLYDPRVDPSAEDNYAIGLASYNGHVEVVRLLLLDPRVDPAACDNYAIKKAAKKGHSHVVDLLLKDKRVKLSLNQVANLVSTNQSKTFQSLWEQTKAAILH
jgi:ankyrin repeat protein